MTTSAPINPPENTTLAFTGFNALRDVEIGGVMIAGGWALSRWASRSVTPAVEGLDAEQPPTSNGDELP
ncbi:MAG TPA: hypothetical protein VGG38_01875 [Acidimicrobiales bacterium]